MANRKNEISKQDFYKFAKKLSLSFKSYEEEKDNIEEKESWDAICKQIRSSKKMKLHRKLVYASSIAASFILIVVSVYFLKSSTLTDKHILPFPISQLATPENNSEILLITPDQKLNIANNSKLKYTVKGELLIDSTTIEQSPIKESIDAPSYSQIIVPKGRRSHIFFADGTEMYINSGTTVVYPTCFSKDKREIYVDGEIYLNVKNDKARPFYVKTVTIDLKVLGTSFNVCSYKEDSVTSVVLVSGKVEVENKKREKVTLNPNELLLLDANSMIKSEVDVFDYTCWTQNMMIFKQERLDNLLKKLSLYYGRDIYYSPEIGNRTISGKLDLRDNLESVMDIISTLTSLKYQIKDNSIHID